MTMSLPAILLYIGIGGQSYPVLWSIIGAAVFVAIIHVISGRR